MSLDVLRFQCRLLASLVKRDHTTHQTLCVLLQMWLIMNALPVSVIVFYSYFQSCTIHDCSMIVWFKLYHRNTCTQHAAQVTDAWIQQRNIHIPINWLGTGISVKSAMSKLAILPKKIGFFSKFDIDDYLTKEERINNERTHIYNEQHSWDTSAKRLSI